MGGRDGPTTRLLLLLLRAQYIERTHLLTKWEWTHTYTHKLTFFSLSGRTSNTDGDHFFLYTLFHSHPGPPIEFKSRKPKG